MQVPIAYCSDGKGTADGAITDRALTLARFLVMSSSQWAENGRCQLAVLQPVADLENRPFGDIAAIDSMNVPRP